MLFFFYIFVLLFYIFHNFIIFFGVLQLLYFFLHFYILILQWRLHWHLTPALRMYTGSGLTWWRRNTWRGRMARSFRRTRLGRTGWRTGRMRRWATRKCRLPNIFMTSVHKQSSVSCPSTTCPYAPQLKHFVTPT